MPLHRKAPSPPPPGQRAPTRSVGRETFPLTCPSCGTALTFIAFLTNPQPITRILAHIGEPTSPPMLYPARAPPQTEFHLVGSHANEIGATTVQDDLDQTPEFDATEPEPVPNDHFDQSRNK